jgi:aminoglycoside phosphotransferase (APT) family kinase protein
MAELIDVAPVHRFDEVKLWHYLRSHLEEFGMQPKVQQFQGGQSNPTFLLSAPGRQYVLRKQPPGRLLPSAHAIDREYRVQSALKGTPVPVVPMRLFCEDSSIIGTPFYLMDYVPGRIFAKPDIPEINHIERKEAYKAFAETLAALHEVDFRAIGLGDYGRTEGYAARQLKRWSEQYESAKTGHIEAMDKLIAWLKASVPGHDEAAIAHGDYRIGNMMFEVDEAHIVAVLDWELSTLGHPLADLGYVCMSYRIPANTQLLSGLRGLDLPALGIPAENEFVTMYCHRAGRDCAPDLTFFIALSFFRYASIAQGVYARSLQGNAADRRASFAGEAAIALAEEGWRIAQAAG